MKKGRTKQGITKHTTIEGKKEHHILHRNKHKTENQVKTEHRILEKRTRWEVKKRTQAKHNRKQTKQAKFQDCEGKEKWKTASKPKKQSRKNIQLDKKMSLPEQPTSLHTTRNRLTITNTEALHWRLFLLR